MDNLGFWLFLMVAVTVTQIDKIGNAFKEGCTPVVQEVDDGTE